VTGRQRLLRVARDEGTGPAIVLLHGQPGTAADWDGVMGYLPPTVRAIVPDRPGYGGTGGRAVGFAENADAIVGMLSRLGVDRAHLVGYSWAGGVVLALARDAPERLASMTLVASVRPGAPLGMIDRALGLAVLGPTLAAGTIGLAGRMLLIPQVRRLVDHRYRGLTEEGLTAVGQAFTGSRAWLSFFLEQRALFDELPDLAESLGAVRVPTTILFGSHDRVISPEDGWALANAIPGARAVRVYGAGHLLPHERPELVAATVLDNVLGAEGQPAG
jgi:pimeloyl-ACP methyl ester carboxylesterase